MVAASRLNFASCINLSVRNKKRLALNRSGRSLALHTGDRLTGRRQSGNFARGRLTIFEYQSYEERMILIAVVETREPSPVLMGKAAGGPLATVPKHFDSRQKPWNDEEVSEAREDIPLVFLSLLGFTRRLCPHTSDKSVPALHCEEMLTSNLQHRMSRFLLLDHHKFRERGV